MKDNGIAGLQDVSKNIVKRQESSTIVNLTYGEECFTDVLKKLTELSEEGYHFQLKTKNSESKLCICLNPKKGNEFDAELFKQIVKECAGRTAGRTKSVNVISRKSSNLINREMFQNTEDSLNEETKHKYRVLILKASIAGLAGDVETLFEVLKSQEYVEEIFTRVFLGDKTVVDKYADKESGKFLIVSAIRFWAAARENWKESDLQSVKEYVQVHGFEKQEDKKHEEGLG